MHTGFGFFAFIIAVALGVAAYWQPKLIGPAIAALALGLLGK
jgi:hypothetical protein